MAKEKSEIAKASLWATHKKTAMVAGAGVGTAAVAAVGIGAYLEDSEDEEDVTSQRFDQSIDCVVRPVKKSWRKRAGSNIKSFFKNLTWRKVGGYAAKGLTYSAMIIPGVGNVASAGMKTFQSNRLKKQLKEVQEDVKSHIDSKNKELKVDLRNAVKVLGVHNQALHEETRDFNQGLHQETRQEISRTAGILSKQIHGGHQVIRGDIQALASRQEELAEGMLLQLRQSGAQVLTEIRHVDQKITSSIEAMGDRIDEGVVLIQAQMQESMRLTFESARHTSDQLDKLVAKQENVELRILQNRDIIFKGFYYLSQELKTMQGTIQADIQALSLKLSKIDATLDENERRRQLDNNERYVHDYLQAKDALVRKKNLIGMLEGLDELLRKAKSLLYIKSMTAAEVVIATGPAYQVMPLLETVKLYWDQARTIDQLVSPAVWIDVVDTSIKCLAVLLQDEQQACKTDKHIQRDLAQLASDGKELEKLFVLLRSDIQGWISFANAIMEDVAALYEMSEQALCYQLLEKIGMKPQEVHAVLTSSDSYSKGAMTTSFDSLKYDFPLHSYPLNKKTVVYLDNAGGDSRQVIKNDHADGVKSVVGEIPVSVGPGNEIVWHKPITSVSGGYVSIFSEVVSESGKARHLHIKTVDDPDQGQGVVLPGDFQLFNELRSIVNVEQDGFAKRLLEHRFGLFEYLRKQEGCDSILRAKRKPVVMINGVTASGWMEANFVYSKPSDNRLVLQYLDKETQSLQCVVCVDTINETWQRVDVSYADAQEIIVDEAGLYWLERVSSKGQSYYVIKHVSFADGCEKITRLARVKDDINSESIRLKLAILPDKRLILYPYTDDALCSLTNKFPAYIARIDALGEKAIEAIDMRISYKPMTITRDGLVTMYHVDVGARKASFSVPTSNEGLASWVSRAFLQDEREQTYGSMLKELYQSGIMDERAYKQQINLFLTSRDTEGKMTSLNNKLLHFLKLFALAFPEATDVNSTYLFLKGFYEVSVKVLNESTQRKDFSELAEFVLDELAGILKQLISGIVQYVYQANMVAPQDDTIVSGLLHQLDMMCLMLMSAKNPLLSLATRLQEGVAKESKLPSDELVNSVRELVEDEHAFKVDGSHGAEKFAVVSEESMGGRSSREVIERLQAEIVTAVPGVSCERDPANPKTVLNVDGASDQVALARAFFGRLTVKVINDGSVSMNDEPSFECRIS